jgi:hypothetical protein
MRFTITNASAIYGRLVQACDEGWAVQIRLANGIKANGIVALSADLESLEVLTGRAVSKLRSGSVVHASISGPDGALSFYSEFKQIGRNGCLIMDIPRVVRIEDSRCLDRSALDERSNVHVIVPLGEQEQTFEVVDLSSRGLSFRVPTKLYKLNKDQRVRLRLAVPGSPVLRMIVTVRNLRRDPQVAGSRLVGARVEVGPKDLVSHVAKALENPEQAA